MHSAAANATQGGRQRPCLPAGGRRQPPGTECSSQLLMQWGHGQPQRQQQRRRHRPTHAEAAAAAMKRQEEAQAARAGTKQKKKVAEKAATNKANNKPPSCVHCRGSTSLRIASN